MADDLQAAVETMLKAGKPEAEITAYIQQADTATKYDKAMKATTPGFLGTRANDIGALKGIVRTIPDAISFLSSLGSDFPTTAADLKKALVAARNAPATIYHGLLSAYDLAKSDPEAFEEAAGNAAGEAATGAAIGAGVAKGVSALPGAAGTVAREVGTDLSKVSKPFVVGMGAMRAMEGHPLEGAGMMVAPALMRATGRGLLKLAPGATAATEEALPADFAKATAGMPPEVVEAYKQALKTGTPPTAGKVTLPSGTGRPAAPVTAQEATVKGAAQVRRGGGTEAPVAPVAAPAPTFETVAKKQGMAQPMPDVSEPPTGGTRLARKPAQLIDQVDAALYRKTAAEVRDLHRDWTPEQIDVETKALIKAGPAKAAPPDAQALRDKIMAKPGVATPGQMAKGSGVGIPREPPRLILTPEQAQTEQQLLRAFKPSAQLQGMKSAARVPAGTFERMLYEDGIADHMDPEAEAEYRRTVLQRHPTEEP